jgi:hypothetical protein
MAIATAKAARRDDIDISLEMLGPTVFKVPERGLTKSRKS